MKNNSIYLCGMDDVGQILLKRVSGLLDQRPDVTRPHFGRAIQRGHSWISEFLNGLRTTNDLRLVLRMARLFRVPVSYLLGDDDRTPNEATLTLLGAWRDLEPRSKDAVLQLALALRPAEPEPPPPHPPPADNPPAVPHTVPRGGGRTKKPK